MTEAKKASGSRIGEWFENRRTPCPAEKKTLPIGADAGQNTTRTQGNAANAGVLSLVFFHW
ncbi:hypothetical protein ACCD05_31645, partial [Rhizobium sp. Rhizsp42]